MEIMYSIGGGEWGEVGSGHISSPTKMKIKVKGHQFSSPEEKHKLGTLQPTVLKYEQGISCIQLW